MHSFLECERRWYYVYVKGIKGEQKESARFGTEVHAALETYYTVGAFPLTADGRASVVAAKALPFLPSRGPTISCERWIYLDRGDYGYRGIVDMTDDATYTVYDHKTSSYPKRYAKKPGILRRDPQALLYAYDAITKRGWPYVNLQWTYISTTERASHPVRVERLSKAEIEIGLADLDIVTNGMLRRKTLPVIASRLNHDACGDFGGCAFYSSVCDAKKAQKGI